MNKINVILKNGLTLGPFDTLTIFEIEDKGSGKIKINICDHSNKEVDLFNELSCKSNRGFLMFELCDRYALIRKDDISTFDYFCKCNDDYYNKEDENIINECIDGLFSIVTNNGTFDGYKICQTITYNYIKCIDYIADVFQMLQDKKFVMIVKNGEPTLIQTSDIIMVNYYKKNKEELT